MKNLSDKKHALFMAIANTILAVLAALVTLFRYTEPLQIVLTVLWTVIAVLWWMNYAKKQQEEQNHE